MISNNILPIYVGICLAYTIYTINQVRKANNKLNKSVSFTGYFLVGIFSFIVCPIFMTLEFMILIWDKAIKASKKEKK
jgi:hypothetical protein